MNNYYDQEPLSDLDAESFYNIFANRGINLDKNHVVDSINNLLNTEGYPEGLLKRLAQAFTYIDQETFNRDLEDLKEILKANITSDAIIVSNKRNNSSSWIVNLLKEDGLDLPEFVIADEITNKEETNNFVLIDDWSISGGQIKNDIVDLIKRKNPNANFQIFLMYSSELAIQFIQEPETPGSIEIYCLRPNSIKTINEFLEPEDIKFLNELLEQDLRPWDLGEDETLFMGWWAIPDNFLSLFLLDKTKRFGIFSLKTFSKPY